jgi:hypothetical protein
MELSKRAAEVSALEARVSLQSDYIQQLEACVGQVKPSHHPVACGSWSAVLWRGFVKPSQ